MRDRLLAPTAACYAGQRVERLLRGLRVLRRRDLRGLRGKSQATAAESSRSIQPPFDRLHYVVHRDVVDTRGAAPAAALVVTDAAIVLRDRHVCGRPRTVALPLRGAEQRHDWRSDRTGNVQRPGVAGHEQARTLRQCE